MHRPQENKGRPAPRGGCARAVSNPATGGDCAGAGHTVYRGLAPEIMAYQTPQDNIKPDYLFE